MIPSRLNPSAASSHTPLQIQIPASQMKSPFGSKTPTSARMEGSLPLGAGDAGSTRRSLGRSSSRRLGLGRGLFIQRSHSVGDDEADVSSLDGLASVAPQQVKRSKSKLPSLLGLRRSTTAAGGIKSSKSSSSSSSSTGSAPPSLPIIHHTQSTPALFVHPDAHAERQQVAAVAAGAGATVHSSTAPSEGREEGESWLRSAHVTAATIAAFEVRVLVNFHHAYMYLYLFRTTGS